MLQDNVKKIKSLLDVALVKACWINNYMKCAFNQWHVILLMEIWQKRVEVTKQVISHINDTNFTEIPKILHKCGQK